MQKITPFLWFDSEAEEAAAFYVSLLPNSKITGVSRYGEAGPGPAGSVMTVNFVLDGQEFTALNGGPEYRFNPAVSFMIHSKTQEEVDGLWQKLTADGGREVQCGWVTDRYGLSWQVTPDVLMELISDPDQAKSGRVMKAMLRMKKIDIDGLQRAAAG